MTKGEMITWYLSQAEKDGVRNYEDRITVIDVKVLMSMWHDQESGKAPDINDDSLQSS